MACEPGKTSLEFCVLDEDVPRYVEAMSAHFGYTEFLDSPDDLVPNPEQPGAFTKRSMADWMEQIVVEYEFRKQAGSIEVPPVDIE